MPLGTATEQTTNLLVIPTLYHVRTQMEENKTGIFKGFYQFCAYSRIFPMIHDLRVLDSRHIFACHKNNHNFQTAVSEMRIFIGILLFTRNRSLLELTVLGLEGLIV